jgi:alpha-mannosidase
MGTPYNLIVLRKTIGVIMQAQEIVLKRVNKLIGEIENKIFTEISPLTAEFCFSPRNPIPISELNAKPWSRIEIGERWGELWGKAWFRFTSPENIKDLQHDPSCLEAHVDLGAEACVYLDGKPYIALTNKLVSPVRHHLKKRIPVKSGMIAQNQLVIYVDVSANGIDGAWDARDFVLNECRLVRTNRRIEQLFFDFSFLFDLASALPPESHRRREILFRLNEIANVLNLESDLDQVLHDLKRLIRGQGSEYSAEAVSIGHGHLDLAWLWPVDETRRKAIRTSATALRLMEQYPEYRFGFSQPQMYEWIEEDSPELFEEIRTRVEEGRWELFGALWVEPDTNIPSVESLIRQCLYGQRYWKDKFGKTVPIAWLPDTFGFSPALPQILKGCGIDGFVTMKLAWNESNPFPYHAFVWEGIDGSRINAHIMPAHEYHIDNNPAKLRAADGRWEAQGYVGRYINLFGIGDGGGGPSIEHIEYRLRAKDAEGVPRQINGRSDEVFESLKKAGRKLPVWSGELYLELHRGTYTSQAETKRLHALVERELHNYEFYLAASSLSKPSGLDSMWKLLLLSEFHDILPGSSIAEVYQRTEAELAGILAEIRRRTDRHTASDQLPDLETPEPESVLVNTLDVPRTEWFSIGGNAYVSRLEPLGQGALRPVTDASSDPGEGRSGFKKPVLVRDGDGFSLGNGILSCRISADGRLTSLVNMNIGRELITGEGAGFALWPDLPPKWEAWDVPGYYREMVAETPEVSRVELINAESWLPGLRFGFTVGDSEGMCEFSLSPGSGRLDIRVEIDWRERQKMLRFAIPSSIRTSSARCGIQGGYVRRSTVRNTSIEQAAFEVPVHRFADLSDPGAGIALMSFAKYGMYFDGGLMDINLLRSTTDPDPGADRRKHAFRFSLLVHGGEGHIGEVIDEAQRFNHPPMVLSAGTDCSLPIKRSESSIRISRVKPAEDGSGIVIRLSETWGIPSEIELSGELITTVQEIQSCDLLENPHDTLDASDGIIRISLRPFELSTLLLKMPIQEGAQG